MFMSTVLLSFRNQILFIMVSKHMAEEQKMLYLLVYHSSDSLVVALLVESRLATSFFLQPDHEIGYASLPVVQKHQHPAQAQCCSHQILGGQVTSGSACLEAMILLLRAFLGQNKCFLQARRQFHMHEYISCSSHCQALVLASRLFTHLASHTLQDVACKTNHSRKVLERKTWKRPLFAPPNSNNW